MKRFVLALTLLSTSLVLVSCGGGGTPAAVPSIGVSCLSPSVNVNGTVQCTAIISNLSSTLANWQVNTVPSGNSTVGTIDTNGLYTAPKVVPTNNVVTITAVAQAQTSLTGVTNITILPAAAISSISCVDSVTHQASQTVASGLSLLCTATVAGGGAAGVNWFVNGSATCSATLGAPGGSPILGTIVGSPQGNFVAPQIPPPGGIVAITAVSQVDATQTLCVPVTLTFGNAALQGNYAFSTSGRIISGNSSFVRAGSFLASGSGSLIGGIEDVNQAGTVSQHTFTGSYSIGADGRGTMQFCEDISTPCTGAAQVFLRFAVFSPQQAQIIEFSAPASSNALTVAGGEINLQDTSIFAGGPRSLVGIYSFGFAGASQSDGGEFVADGDPGHTGTGAITSGTLDINNNGVTTITGGTYTVSSNGRGTASIVMGGGTFTFSMYLVSASRAKFIETDASAILVGDAFRQQTSSCNWGVTSLSGATVFETGGVGSSGGIGDLVSFTADGLGGATAGSIDENNGGTVSSTQSLSGAYTIGTCGRGTLAISGHSYVFYMISTSSAVIQETTAGVVAHGFVVQPQGGPFTTASLSGSYALNLAGTNAAGATGKRQDIVGQVTANGTGNVTASTLDVNSFGATQVGVASIGTYTPVAANGRTTMLFNSPTRNLVLYLVSPTQAFALDTDSASPAIGSLNKQF